MQADACTYVESKKSSSVLERQSQKILRLSPKGVQSKLFASQKEPLCSVSSSNRFVGNRVTSIFGPIEDRLCRETKEQRTRSYNLCAIIRLFRLKHGAQPNERICSVKSLLNKCCAGSEKTPLSLRKNEC